jgi:DNA-binding SARP family transcriptional activator/Flp pilus assembly protein TadD
MLRLVTFGGLRLERDGEADSALANQRRRLAVLAVLAAAAPKAVPRERLMLLLWPDADEDRGRHALNQIIYNLRRELGVSPIDGVGELRLLADVIETDHAEFRAAVAGTDHHSVASLYSGPFLDGFFVPGAGELDRWIEEERHRTHRVALTSLVHLANAAEQQSDNAAFVQWSGRLAELDPLSARETLRHMRALSTSGDQDAAIRSGRRYEVLARADGDDVSADVLAEIARLKAAHVTVASSPTVVRGEVTVADEHLVPLVVSTESSAHAVAAEVPVITESGDDGAAPQVALEAAPAATAPKSATRRRLHVLTRIAAVAVLGFSSVAWWVRDQPAASPAGAGPRILFADMHVSSNDSASARAIGLALQTALQQSARVRFLGPATIRDALERMGRLGDTTAVIDATAAEVAEREGARYVLDVAVDASGPDRQLTARLIDPRSRTARLSVSERTSEAALLTGVDRLAMKLQRALSQSAQQVDTAPPLPRASTASLEALRLYAAGQAAFSHAQYDDARTLYANALAIDSTFAAAHAAVAYVSYVMNDAKQGDADIARALHFAERLPPRERMLIEATAARGRDDWRKAAMLHRAYLIRYPDDYDTYQLLAYDLMRAGLSAEAAVAFDTVQAHRPLTSGMWINVAAVNAGLGRYHVTRRAHVEALKQDSSWLTKSMQNEQFGFTLLRLGHADSARAVFSVLLKQPVDDQARGHRSLAYVDLYEGRYTAASEHLRRAVSLGEASGASATSQIRTRALLGSTLLSLGQTSEAREQLRAAMELCLSSMQDPRLLFWTGKPLARMGETAAVRLLLDSARARARPESNDQMSAVRALEAELRVAQGSAIAAAVPLARRAAETGDAPYVLETLAYTLFRSDSLVEARRVFDQLRSQELRAIGAEGQQSARLAPLTISAIDARVGRVSDAATRGTTLPSVWQHADPGLLETLTRFNTTHLARR